MQLHIQYNKGMTQKQTSYSLRQKNYQNNKKYSRYNVLIVALITAAIIFIIINYIGNNLFRHLLSHKNFIHTSHNHSHQKAPYLISNPKPLQKQIQYSTSTKLSKIDKNSKHISKFTLNRPSITFNGPSKKWTQLLTQKPILYNQTYSIKAVISYSSNGEIMLGVTNTNRINEQSSFFNEDTYVYYGNNGCLWAQGILMIKDQVGFKEKDVLKVIVQLWNGLIQWKVNDQIRGQIYSDNLKNSEKKFVAYLEMYEKNDQIRQILNESGSNSSVQI